MPWDRSQQEAVVKTLAIVCELTGTQLSDPAKGMMVKQLAGYPARQVLGSLERCAAECKFKLTLADVISRLEDGRPGAEEAWANFPKSEDQAGIVTDEMSVAWGAAAPLYGSDHVGSRMAFKEAYERETRKARAEGRGPKWRVSPGFDKASTESIAIEGMKSGQLSAASALQYILPEHHDHALYVAGLGPKALPAPDQRSNVRGLIASLTEKLSAPIANPTHWTEEK